MTNRELLELAAKAAGITLGEYWTPYLGSHHDHCWNPLTDDGDALRLAVKLNLLTTECVEDWKWCRDKTEHADVCASYRRAITRAAAEIGRTTT
jgi:hypothetical protein